MLNSKPAPGERFFSYTLKYPWIMLLIGILITILAYVGTTNLKIQTNFVDLLPDHQPEVIELRKLQKIVGGASFVILTIESSDPELAPVYLEKVSSLLKDDPDIRYIDYKPPYDFFSKNALLYLTPVELEDYLTRLGRRIDQLKLGNFMIDLSRPDERISFEELENRYSFIKHRYYRNKSGSLFVMLIKPKGRSTNTEFTKRLINRVREANITARKELGAPYSNEESFVVRLTGPYVKALTQVESVLADAKRVAAIALISMIGFLYLYFRRKRAVAVIAAPLAAGIFWSLGSAYLIIGELNFFTSIVCAVLLGLSADFGIHMFSHYREHRRTGTGPKDSLRLTYRDLIRSMCLAGVTTSAAFFALALSDFKPLYQFGIIAGVGMFCSLISLLILFPAVILIFEKFSPLEINAPEPRLAATAKNILPKITSRTGIILTSSFFILMIIPIALGGIHFDYNYANIMGNQDTKELDGKVDSIFSYSINPEIARAQSAEDAGKFANAIRNTRNVHRDSPEGTMLQSAIALSDFVPKDQEFKIAKIAEIRALFTDTVVKMMPKDEKDAYERMQLALHPKKVTFEDLPNELLTKFTDLEGNVGRFIYIFPSYDRQNGKELRHFVNEVTSIECLDCEKPVTITGESIVFYNIIQTLLEEGRWVIAVSILTVALSLWFAFRNAVHALRCFLPLGVGMLGILGLMGIMDVKFTVVNLAAVPVLLGTGIDYSIYFYQQYRQTGIKNFQDCYVTVAPPIMASAITTACGFGALLTADSKGVQSFGAVTTLGILSCAFATLLWFPGWLAWINRNKEENK